MKKMIVLLVLMVSASPFLLHAQADFAKGTVVTATNETLEGTIRDQTKNKGTIVFESSAGRKKVYTAAELNGFTLNGANYISYSSDFYKVIVPTGKAGLCQRVTDNSGKMLYNGAEVVVVTTAEGKSGDFYIQKTDGQFFLVSQKNFETVTLAAFADCATVVAEIKTKQVDYTQLTKLVEHYNSCK